jgi:dTDP-4-dehydrorhamnose 3,5-epimerase
MQMIKTSLPGVLIIEPEVFQDSRGFFMETYHQERYKEIGIDDVFVQDNFSHSNQNVLRGLHYQRKHPQAKLVHVIKGIIFDVVVDIRLSSPWFGQWLGKELSEFNGRQIYVPKGFAHGFCVLSETADVLYKCSDIYRPDDEGGIHWSDPEIGIKWPVNNPLLSEKDSKFSRLDSVGSEQLPIFEGSD